MDKKWLDDIKALAFVAALIFVMAIPDIINVIILPHYKYNRAMQFKADGKFEEAREIFGELFNYKDAKEQVTECDYCNAVALTDNGKYPEALALFNDLNGYKDSIDLIYKINFEDGYIGTLDVGDTFLFGNKYGCMYEWLILDKKDSKLLVTTNVIIGKAGYSKVKTNAEWGKCSLRYWLCNDFYETVLTEEEKAKVLLTDVPVDLHDCFTQDRMFLLSVEEAEKYFPTEESRKCIYSYDTSVSSEKSPQLSDSSSGYLAWWLRTPGTDDQYCTAYVDSDGRIDLCGVDSVDFKGLGIRPAMWIDIDI
ncbi:MAG: DUF6273 domain-containing protein [Clostridia bacterium]|nr:DUF6273 domain-containing protein [Clostridia bacterium]